MKVAFRTDASIEIGTGHVMRCLTLAQELRDQGAQCSFVMRDLPANFLDFVQANGFEISRLPKPDGLTPTSPPAHAAWAGVNWEVDAQQTSELLQGRSISWLVMDHYAFDHRWQSVVSPYVDRLMVIDDLADRPHQCDLLLDQNLGRAKADYQGFLPAKAELLVGPQYALLRKEFAIHRAASLSRRSSGTLGSLLISMGGVDKDNVTGKCLEALSSEDAPLFEKITVILGQNAPYLDDVITLAEGSRHQIQVLSGVSDIAALMSDHDVAIGAAGATAWERCCMGLPTLLFVIAENQVQGANALENVGAVKLMCSPEQMVQELKWLASMQSGDSLMLNMSRSAAKLVDGYGANKVAKRIISYV